MAKIVRNPPGPADRNDPRAQEYFFQDVLDQNRVVGTRTYDLPSINAGATETFTVTAKGAKPDKAQTIEYGLPSTWNTGLIVAAVFVSAADTVTFVIYNPTGGSINQASGTYSVRVRP